jgi:acyl carrier protein
VEMRRIRHAAPGTTLHSAKGRAVVIDDVRMVVSDALQLGARGGTMAASTPLLGAIPELDSMAVVSVITALEEHFGISVADDEIGAATFATLGSLSAFVEKKLEA